jgi:hypothetical protein
MRLRHFDLTPQPPSLRGKGEQQPKPLPVAGRGWGGVSGRVPRPGMSLIEVLLGLTILLMSLVAIGQLVDIGSDRGMDARMHIRGNRLAQAKMAEVEAGVVALDGGSSGTFDDEPEWNWSVETSSPGPANLYLVTVKVSRDLKVKPFEVTMSQHMMDPTKMGTAAQAEKPTTTDTTTAPSTTGGMP